jgi:hypothetical protein
MREGISTPYPEDGGASSLSYTAGVNGPVWAAPAGAALALLAIWGSLHFLRKRRLIADIPTSKADGVFIGLVELKGRAESGRPLTSYLAERPCVLYSWSIQEHWSRTVVETVKDSDGKTRTQTRTETGWTSVADGGEQIPFYVADDSGAVRVVPDGAKIEPLEVYAERCGRGDPLYYGKGPSTSVANSTHERRFHETAIPLGAELYVVGQAREREDVVAPEIAAAADAPIFLISTRTEGEVGSGLTATSWVFGLLAMFAATGGALLASRKPWIGGVAAAGALAVWGVGWVWTAYNSLVNLRQRVRQAASRVDVELKRRADLIPRLVGTVEGLRDHERTLQAQVAALRAQAGATRPGEPGPDPEALLPAVRTVVERYPELKAQEAFLKLQEELAETEQRLALARSYFNEIASFFNTRLEQVPDRFLAGLGAMKPAALIGAAGFERAPVAVDFASG